MATMQEIHAAVAQYDEAMVALVKDGEVVNVAVVNDESEDWLEAVAPDFDAIELVGERDRPAPGWKVKGKKWEAPPVPEPTPEQVAADREAKAKADADSKRRTALIAEAKKVLADPKSSFADRAAADAYLSQHESATA